MELTDHEASLAAAALASAAGEGVLHHPDGDVRIPSAAVAEMLALALRLVPERALTVQQNPGLN